MDEAVASNSIGFPSGSPTFKVLKKRKSALERELETNMTEKMTSPQAAGDNGATSRYGRARKIKPDGDFLPSDKVSMSQKKTVLRKVSPPRSPTVFKMNASKSPTKIFSPRIVASPSHSAANSIDELLNQNQCLSRFSNEVHSPPKYGKVYVRKDLIQNRDRKTSSIIKNMFSPIKSPLKSLNNSSHLNSILERASSVNIGSKLMVPGADEKFLSPQKSLAAKKKLSPRQVGLKENPSVIKMLSFSEESARKCKANKVETVSPPNTRIKCEPPVQVDSAYEALERSCSYQANDLAWARIGSYPYWPCLITRDPYTGHMVKEKVVGGRQSHRARVIHVTYLGDNGRRGWLHENSLRPFRGLVEFQAARDAFTPDQKKKDAKLYAAYLISEKKKKVWNDAVEEGEMLLTKPSHTRIDLLYEMVYKPNQKIKGVIPPVPPMESVNSITHENRKFSLSESLLDTLFCEDDSKINEKVRSRNSLDVSDVVTACLDDMATKTGNIKIQKQSHMDRWLQKAKSATPEKAVEKVKLLSAEKIRSRKNKRDIPSDDSDVSRTIQKLNKRPRHSANYSLRTDSSSGVDSEESKRNSLEDRLHDKKVQHKLNGILTDKLVKTANITDSQATESISEPVEEISVSPNQKEQNNDIATLHTANINKIHESTNLPVTNSDAENESNSISDSSTATIKSLQYAVGETNIVSIQTDLSLENIDKEVINNEHNIVIGENLPAPVISDAECSLNNEELDIRLRIDESSSDIDNSSLSNSQNNVTKEADVSKNNQSVDVDDTLGTHDQSLLDITPDYELKSLTNTNSQKCMVFLKRLDLKPHMNKLINNDTEVSKSNVQLVNNKIDAINADKSSANVISQPKRELRSRKNEIYDALIKNTSNEKEKISKNFTVSDSVTASSDDDETNTENNFVNRNKSRLESKFTAGSYTVSQPYSISEQFTNKTQQNGHASDEIDTKGYDKDKEKEVLENCGNKKNVLRNLIDTTSESSEKENGLKKSYDSPAFIMYLESKQDELMDANPHLNREELITHIYSVWEYEESKKSKEMKCILKSFDTDWSVKPQELLVEENSNHRKPVPLVICSEVDKLICKPFNKKYNNTDKLSESFEIQNIILNDSKTSVEKKLTSNTDNPNGLIVSKTKQQLLNDDITTEYKETKTMLNGFSVSSNKSEESTKIAEENETEELCKSTAVNGTDLTNDINCDFDERLKVSEVAAKEISKTEESILTKPSKPDCPDIAEAENVTFSESKHLFEVSVERERFAVNKEKVANDLECIITPKQNICTQEAKMQDESISLENNAESSSSESEIEVEISSEENDKTFVNKYNDPNFSKYVETKRDTLIDENPHLTEGEIMAYLYDMWSFSEKNKKDEMKNQYFDEEHLVKGLGREAVVQPKKKYKKRVRVKSSKEFKNVEEVFIAKDKPSRKKTVQTYYDHDTDSDSELVREKSDKSINIDIAVPSQSLYSKANGEIADSHTNSDSEIDMEQSNMKNDLFIAELLKPKPNLFKGLIRERLCEICETAGNLVKCRGNCGGMFHVECVWKKSQAKPDDLPKKKKKPTRTKKVASDSDLSQDKVNGIDSDGSDEKSQENIHIDESSDVKTQTIENADNFESQLELKMKEILDVARDDESLCSSGDEMDWANTVAGQCEIVDIKLRLKSEKKPEDYLINFKCNDCQKYDQAPCFVCKSVTSPKARTETKQKCGVIHCSKVYHLECLTHWPQTQFSSGSSCRSDENEQEVITCPRHVCHTCVCDDPRGCKTRFSGDKLARCVRCPAVYHSFTKCLPAGTKILNGSHIICPRHYEQKPGKVPYHVNTSWCFICALGGTLICCEYCPMSFHADCLNIQPPEDGYMCEDCETGRLPLYGEMVWAKLGNYRWWPGLVLHPQAVPTDVARLRSATGEFVVRFFGGNDHFWLYRGRVFPYQEGDTGKVSTQKSKIDTEFAVAVEQAQRTYNVIKEARESEMERRDIAASLLPPHYVKLKVNRPHGSLAAAPRRAGADEEGSATQCDCRADDDEPCGVYTQCLNRVMLTECGATCRAGDRCHNRAFELRQYPRLAPQRTPHRGWGLHTLEDIKKGQFVIEYVGELLDDAEFRRRMRRMHEVRDENYYFLTLDKDRMIDAGPKGNAARFMNHSCEPNCETQKWTVLGDVRVGLFALCDIRAGSEVTFNYNLECAGVDKKRCMCGAGRCAGYIGAKPKQEEPKPKQQKRKYRKRARAEPAAGAAAAGGAGARSPAPAPARKPRCSNTSLNATFKSKEMLELEQDLLIIRNATRDRHDDDDTPEGGQEGGAEGGKRKRVGFSGEGAAAAACYESGSPRDKRPRGAGDGDELCRVPGREPERRELFGSGSR